MARMREDYEAEARCLSERVASAQQQGRGTTGEEATDRRQEEDQERAAGEVRWSGGLMPPPSVNMIAEIEEEFAEAKAEQKRKYCEWRQHVDEVMGKLEDVITEVIEKAPHGSMRRRKGGAT